MCFSAAVNELRFFIRGHTELSIAEIEYVLMSRTGLLTACSEGFGERCITGSTFVFLSFRKSPVALHSFSTASSSDWACSTSLDNRAISSANSRSVTSTLMSLRERLGLMVNPGSCSLPLIAFRSA